MLLLTDRSLEIPAFLQRTASGQLRYPGIAVALPPAVTEPASVELSYEQKREVGLALDRKVIAVLKREQTLAEKTRNVSANKVARDRRREEKEREHETLMKARLEFFKTFGTKT